MKISFGIISDIHIGHYSGKVEKGGVNARFLDFVATYNESIDRIISDKMDFCLIPGDIFRTKKPGPEELDAFVAGLIKLIKKEIPIIVTLGNHDLFLYEGGTHSLSGVSRILEYVMGEEKLGADSFILSSQPEIVKITIKGQPIQIQTMPYPIRSLLRLESKADVEKYMVDKINDVYDSRDKSIPIIFAGHFSLSEALVGGEQINFDKFAEPVISSSVFIGKEYKYVAMGHLHQYQVVLDKPLVVYSGSNNRVDHNEAKEDKGFVEAFIDEDGSTRHEFVKVNARKFIDLKYDLSEEKEPTAVLMKYMKEREEEIRDAVVRLIITISSGNVASYDDKAIIDFLNKHCYHIHGSTIPIVKRVDSVKKITGFVETMDALAALRHYSGFKNIDNKDEFMRLGEEIIRETKGGTKNVMP